MLTEPLPILTHRTGIMQVRTPVNSDLSWVQTGLEVPGRTCGHGRIPTCCAPPGAAPVLPAIVNSGRTWHPFQLVWDVVCPTMCGTETEVARIVDDLATVDEAWLLARALQFGAGGNPGLVTLPIAPAGSGCDVKVITGVIDDPNGPALPLTSAVATMLSYWADTAAGIPIIHAATILAPLFAHANLIDPAAQGTVTLAGGSALMSFGPGYDPQVGPAGILAGPGEAWLWATGAVYAETATMPTSTSRDTGANTVQAQTDRVGVYAFDCCGVVAVKVELPC